MRDAERLLRWGATAAAIVAVVLLCVSFVRLVRSAPFTDFEAYYHAAVTLRDGGRLYERALAWREAGYLWALVPPGQGPEGVPYVYAPAFAFAMLPLTTLSFRVASIVWCALVLACLVGTAYLLAALLFPASRLGRPATALVLAALASLYQPVRAGLWAGQADTVVLLLLVLALASFCAGRDTRSGIWLGLAMAIKPTLGFLVLFALWKRAYRMTVVAGALSAGVIGLPLLAMGPDTIADFIDVATYWSSPRFATSLNNQSPYGVLLRLFTTNAYTVPLVELPHLVDVLRYAIGATALIALGWSVTRRRDVPVRRLALEYGLTIVALLLVSPLSEDIHYAYLLVPFAAAAASLGAQPYSRATVALGAALVLVYAYLCLPKLNEAEFFFYAFLEGPVRAPLSLLTGVHLYALFVLAPLTVMILRRQPRSVGAASAPAPTTLAAP